MSEHTRSSYLGMPQAKQYQHMIAELKAEIEQLRAALALSQSQNYCTLCGAALDGTSGEHVATSGDRSNK